MKQPPTNLERLLACEKELKLFRADNVALKQHLKIITPLAEWAINEIMARQKEQLASESDA